MFISSVFITIFSTILKYSNKLYVNILRFLNTIYITHQFVMSCGGHRSRKRQPWVIFESLINSILHLFLHRSNTYWKMNVHTLWQHMWIPERTLLRMFVIYDSCCQDVKHEYLFGKSWLYNIKRSISFTTNGLESVAYRLGLEEEPI